MQETRQKWVLRLKMARVGVLGQWLALAINLILYGVS